MKTTTIRTAKKHDIKALVKIEQAVYGDDTFDGFRLNKKELKTERKDDDIVMLVISYDDELAGYALIDVASDDPSAANIDSLAVAPKFADKGLENLLLAAAEQVAVENGFNAIDIQQPESFDANLKALRRVGYTKSGVLSGYYNGAAGLELRKTLIAKTERKNEKAPTLRSQVSAM